MPRAVRIAAFAAFLNLCVSGAAADTPDSAPGLIIPDGLIRFDIPELPLDTLKSSSTALDDVLWFDPITVYPLSDVFLDSDAALRELGGTLPCLGCDGFRDDALPFAVRLGLGVGLFAARMFFQQPRIRGEPMDEALYHSIRAAQCIDGTSGCFDRHPNPGLYNWLTEDSD